MFPSHRVQRLRLPWLLVLPFLYLADPTPTLLLSGALLALPGVLLRVLASFYIDKDRTLATRGPYALVRHPLYLGSFLTGGGLALAGGRWYFILLFPVLFLWLYGRALRAEDRVLERLFGQEYLAYRSAVGGVIPGWGGGRSRRPSDPGGRPPGPWVLFRRNRGWETPLGVVLGFGLLWLRMKAGF